MASNTVSFLLPFSPDTQFTGNHEAEVQNDRIRFETKSAAGNESRFDAFSSEFDLPIILPDDITLIDFTFDTAGGPLQNDSGYNVVAVLENIEYGGSETALLANHINNYKKQYNSWPNLKFKVVSWVFVPNGRDASFWITMQYPKVVCVSEGKEVRIRPVSDVSVGHDIPEGFTGVYQLLNEIEADDEITEIRSGTSGETKTSTVKFTPPLLRPSLIQQIRLYSRIKVEGDSGSYSNVEIMVIAGSKTMPISYFYTRQDSTPNINNINPKEYESWETGSYYNYFSVKTNKDAFVTTLNNYIETYHEFPSFSIKISTTGDYDSNKSTKAESHVSQVYMELVLGKSFGLGIFDKAGGEYKETKLVLRKNNTGWYEIAEDEAKSILNNNTIRRG